jgi:hypothetical protein
MTDVDVRPPTPDRLCPLTIPAVPAVVWQPGPGRWRAAALSDRVGTPLYADRVPPSPSYALAVAEALHLTWSIDRRGHATLTRSLSQLVWAIEQRVPTIDPPPFTVLPRWAGPGGGYVQAPVCPACGTVDCIVGVDTDEQWCPVRVRYAGEKVLTEGDPLGDPMWSHDRWSCSACFSPLTLPAGWELR